VPSAAPAHEPGIARWKVRRGRSPAKADASVACRRCFSKHSTPSHSVKLCDRVLIAALGYCKERLSWLASQTTAARRIRSPFKGETFAYFWLQK